MLDGIEGLRRYLGVAEEDRLEMLHPPEKTPELFERLLPYAIALDVENTWAQRFAGVLSAAATSVVTTSHGVTTWYAGNRDLPRPSYCRVGLYRETRELGQQYAQDIAAAAR